MYIQWTLKLSWSNLASSLFDCNICKYMYMHVYVYTLLATNCIASYVCTDWINFEHVCVLNN